MSMTPEPPQSRPRIWLRVVLALSLALNLLFVGLVAGAAMRFGGMGAHRMPPPVGSALYRAMPRDDRRALREMMFDRHRDDRAEERRADARAIAEVLRAEPYDGAALERVVRDQLARRHGWMESAQAEWLDRVGAMSADERRAYADRLNDAMTAKSRRRGWWRDRPGD